MFIEKVLAATPEETAEQIVDSLNQAFEFIGGINNLLIFGLTIGGAIALGTIIYAGILYSMAGDNSSKQKEAREWIWAAVKGLAVIAFGFILLALINPGVFVPTI
jgi:hypothetical protein